MSVLDDLFPLQRSGCQAYARAIRPQHRPQKVVSNPQQAVLHPILGQQQPPGQALFKIMQTITTCRLCDLHLVNRCIPIQQHLKLWT